MCITTDVNNEHVAAGGDKKNPKNYQPFAVDKISHTILVHQHVLTSIHRFVDRSGTKLVYFSNAPQHTTNIQPLRRLARDCTTVAPPRGPRSPCVARVCVNAGVGCRPLAPRVTGNSLFIFEFRIQNKRKSTTYSMAYANSATHIQG